MPHALNLIRISELAAIQYVGSGESLACLDALRRELASPERPQSARLLTAERSHAFLLTFERQVSVVVKDGFTSGYHGAGPTALAEALTLLREVHIDFEEVEVGRDVIARLGASALTRSDLEHIEQCKPVRPSRWHDYVYSIFKDNDRQGQIWSQFHPVMPYGILDARLIDLALDFNKAPDRVLLDGFRLLEDRIRERTGLAEIGSKLFSQAFAVEDSPLMWNKPSTATDSIPGPIDKGEQVGRAQLFTGAYQAFRNPRAHRMQKDGLAAALSEFLLLNQLFLFEAEAVERPVSRSPDGV